MPIFASTNPTPWHTAPTSASATPVISRRPFTSPALRSPTTHDTPARVVTIPNSAVRPGCSLSSTKPANEAKTGAMAITSSDSLAPMRRSASNKARSPITRPTMPLRARKKSRWRLTVAKAGPARTMVAVSSARARGRRRRLTRKAPIRRAASAKKRPVNAHSRAVARAASSPVGIGTGGTPAGIGYAQPSREVWRL